MKKLKISLENCYGIKEFDEELNFLEKQVVAIYASNGIMKTSFAKTFKNLSEGENSEDKIFTENKTKREIKDEYGKDLDRKNVCVIESYTENNFGKGKEILLASEDLQNKYQDINENIDRHKTNFLEKIGKRERKDTEFIETEIKKSFSNKNFFNILESCKQQIEDKTDSEFKDILYTKIFTEKIVEFLNTKDIKKDIEEYVEKYDELLKKSKYLQQEFNHYNMSQITKNLKSNGFFKASHSINLHSGDSKKEIKNADEFNTVIKEEKDRILQDPELEKKWNDIDAKIEKNQELRGFQKYLLENKQILKELRNLEEFAKEIWLSYFITHKDSFQSLVDKYKKEKEELLDIVACAKKEETSWEQIIKQFNERFSVPFKVVVKNKHSVILDRELPNIEFEFKDGNENMRAVEEADLRKVLSGGERRALYILDILFEIEKRKKEGNKTLFIIDDIVDSFDYKNKYAIIQYLQEISETSIFNFIILTHNFDFFRTIHRRGIVDYKNCYFVSKNRSNVKLKRASGINNPFINDWLLHLDEQVKLIATIPFARNIIEYTKGQDDEDYKKLTSLLHWRENTEKILVSDLKKILECTFNQSNLKTNLKCKVIDIIFKQSKECLESEEESDLEKKIVLSIGSRLKAEQFMIAQIKKIDKNSDCFEKRTNELFSEYQNKYPNKTKQLKILEKVNIITPENIHLNSFMYEPILDMSDCELKELYKNVKDL